MKPCHASTIFPQKIGEDEDEDDRRWTAGVLIRAAREGRDLGGGEKIVGNGESGNGARLLALGPGRAPPTEHTAHQLHNCKIPNSLGECLTAQRQALSHLEYGNPPPLLRERERGGVT